MILCRLHRRYTSARYSPDPAWYPAAVSIAAGVFAIKGPGLRIACDVRRHFQCPACGRIHRPPIEVVQTRCNCQPKGVWMKLLDPPPPLSPSIPESVIAARRAEREERDAARERNADATRTADDADEAISSSDSEPVDDAAVEMNSESANPSSDAAASVSAVESDPGSIASEPDEAEAEASDSEPDTVDDSSNETASHDGSESDEETTDSDTDSVTDDAAASQADADSDSKRRRKPRGRNRKKRGGRKSG